MWTYHGQKQCWDRSCTHRQLSEVGHSILFSKKYVQFLKLYSCLVDTEVKQKENALRSHSWHTDINMLWAEPKHMKLSLCLVELRKQITTDIKRKLKWERCAFPYKYTHDFKYMLGSSNHSYPQDFILQLIPCFLESPFPFLQSHSPLLFIKSSFL